MTFKVKQKSKKPKYAYELRIGKDVIRAKSKREMDRKLKNGVILWRTPLSYYDKEVKKLGK